MNPLRTSPSLIVDSGLVQPKYEGVAITLEAYGSLCHMPAENPGLIGQRHELSVDVVHQLLVVAAGEISASDTQIEQGIAAEQHSMPVQAYTFRTMAGSMKNRETQFTNLDHIPFTKQPVRLRRSAEGAAQH